MSVLINGKLNSEMIILDAGFYYGYGIFETIHIINGSPILLREHLKRLDEGLSVLGIRQKIVVEDVLEAIKKLKCINSALKINVSEENIIYSTKPITYGEKQYELGVKLSISKVLRNPTSNTVSIKSANYIDNSLELKVARAKGYQDVLFMNHMGHVCETAIANIFMITEGEIITPKLSCGLLEGTMRQWVLRNNKVICRKVTLDNLVKSEGVFITNSLMGIMKVVQIGKHIIPISKEIENLSKQYQGYIKSIGEQ